MRGFFVQKLAVFFSCILFPDVVFSFYRTYVLFYFLIGGDHIQMKIQQNMSLMENLRFSQTLQNTMSPARQAVWTAVVTVSALATPFPVGSVILFRRWAVCFPSQDFIYKRMYF